MEHVLLNEGHQLQPAGGTVLPELEGELRSQVVPPVVFEERHLLEQLDCQPRLDGPVGESVDLPTRGEGL